jgi:hypothetical protein
MTRTTVDSVDSVSQLLTALGDHPAPEALQELRELERIEQIRRNNGLETRYALALRSGRLTGYVPVYPTPSWFLPAGHIAKLFALADSANWSSPVLIGSDGNSPSTLRATAGSASAALVDAALRIAHEHSPDLICLPYLDEAQHAAVRPAVPPAPALAGEREEAYFDLPFPSFDDYLRTLSQARRGSVRRERRAFLRSGLIVHPVPAADAVDLDYLLFQVEHKYGASTSLELERIYLETTADAMGESGHALVCCAADRPVAVVILWDLGPTWRVRCWGCDYGSPLIRDARVYFNLVFYESIIRACEAGASRLMVGTGSPTPKIARGARTRTLRSVGWEPR